MTEERNGWQGSEKKIRNSCVIWRESTTFFSNKFLLKLITSQIVSENYRKMTIMTEFLRYRLKHTRKQN